MISFYPGPSRVHGNIPTYVKQAYREGIMEMNHRSAEFITMTKQTVWLLKKKLRIPHHYTVLFASSATECWEIIAQSLITQKSTHIYNGAFGKKWRDYTAALVASAEAYAFDANEVLPPDNLTFHESEVICLTHNETSNGTALSNKCIKQIAVNNPHALVAVDATSSMAGVYLDFKAADCWFASVQKCFGLPAGLALMVLSPKAVERAASIAETKHYNSLNSMVAMMQRWQTTHTPNVLGIYLLMRVLEKMDDIKAVEEKLVKRYIDWENYFDKSTQLKFLINNQQARSLTVLTISATEKLVKRVKRESKQAGYLLGKGYGEYKTTTFRIANFPALKQKEIKALQDHLLQYL
jgi:phosphoserine aminotransferase